MVLFITGCANSVVVAQTYPEITIPNTELRPMQSKILGQELNLYIKLPASYRVDEQRIYPVMYATDANRSFAMLANILFVVESPAVDYTDVVLIGIGYKLSGLADWARWRTRDLTPVNVPATDQYWSDLLTKMTGQPMEVKSGGAEKFLDCIINEVIPFTESSYRISKTDRALGGYSYGGLFSLYALFKHPETFQKYFAGSPSIGFGNGILFDMENESAGGRTDLNVQLFMTAGSLEGESMTGNVRKMTEQLQSRNYPGLKVSYQVFDNEDHRSCYPTALMRAIREFYWRPKK